ncbi:hypothetical protein [Leifsonia sp. Leaf264]|uniref:hypothetical protein n=1 Tax=Leifsonia sp. Leaf264 TaxID=1736314 RepID=UPI0009E87114|nr:hypothetical protein [Leifsonia sp. Leaf264]
MTAYDPTAPTVPVELAAGTLVVRDGRVREVVNVERFQHGTLAVTLDDLTQEYWAPARWMQLASRNDVETHLQRVDRNLGWAVGVAVGIVADFAAVYAGVFEAPSITALADDTSKVILVLGIPAATAAVLGSLFQSFRASSILRPHLSRTAEAHLDRISNPLNFYEPASAVL